MKNITPHQLRPLPGKVPRLCSLCGGAQARWMVTRASEEAVCGLCVLFRSGWGLSNAQRVEDAITQVQHQRPTPFGRFLGTSVLASCQDADDVLGVLVLTDLTLLSRSGHPGTQ